MGFVAPDANTLKEVAESLKLELNEKQLGEILGYLGPFSAGYEYLEKESEPLPEISFPQREYREPGADENDLGAWYVLTSLQGNDKGPLKGKKIAIKDNIFVAGVPMMNGAAFLQGFVPDYDASVVTRLLEAGAEIAGKAVCEFLCISGGSATASSGIVQNPHKQGFSAGGSSSGSAALVGVVLWTWRWAVIRLVPFEFLQFLWDLRYESHIRPYSVYRYHWYGGDAG